MSVPDTNTFTLQDVVDEVNPTTDDLVDCFSDAQDHLFDADYVGDKDRLSNFRNYGVQPTAIGAEVDTLQLDYQMLFMDGSPDEEWFYGVEAMYPDLVILSPVIRAYRCQSDGSLTKSSYYKALGDCTVSDFIVVDTDIMFVAYKYESGGYVYQRILSVGFATTSWPENDSILQLMDGDTEDLEIKMAYDSTSGYLYYANRDTDASTNYVWKVSVDGSGNFGTPTSTGINAGSDIYAMHAENGFLFFSKLLSTTPYLYSYSINSSTGALTFADNVNTTITSSTVLNFLSGNGHNIIYGAYGAGTEIISYDSSGNLTAEDVQAISNGGLCASFSKKTRGYFTCSETYLILQTINSSTDIVNTDSQQPAEDVTGGATEELFETFFAFANMKYSYVVVAGFHDPLIGAIDFRMFCYSITS